MGHMAEIHLGACKLAGILLLGGETKALPLRRPR